MSIDLQDSDLNKFILVGDRVLIKPKNLNQTMELSSCKRKFIVAM